MPPHCDTLDGPVVTAAKKGLDSGNVNLILPWAPKRAEAEIKTAFDKALAARKLGEDAKDVADLWFFETIVRLHRAGEGAPYTGLKPAGLDEGPVVPKVEEALEKGNAKDVVKLLSRAVEEEVTGRFNDALSKKKYDPHDVDSAREYVNSFLGLTLYSHHLYEFIKTSGHHGGREGEDKHGA